MKRASADFSSTSQKPPEVGDNRRGLIGSAADDIMAKLVLQLEDRNSAHFESLTNDA